MRLYHTLNNEINVKFDIRFCPKKKQCRGCDLMLGGYFFYNWLCNHCLSLLTLGVRIPLRRGVLDTTLCDKVFR